MGWLLYSLSMGCFVGAAAYLDPIGAVAIAGAGLLIAAIMIGTKRAL